jgi:glycosyltransferase involved in cell wall biosynthesis
MMRAAKLFLMPGLVGLAVLDAAAARLPVVTTAYPWHSPEIAYLEDGVNGAIVREWQSKEAYAGEVVALLRDEARRERLAQAAGAMAERYTIEAMAGKFVDGVLEVLEC